MKQKLVFLLMILIVSLINVLSIRAVICYQEFANVSTSCGGLNTGNYQTSSGADPQNAMDGDYTTYATSINPFEVNYTKIPNIYGVIWQEKTGPGTHNWTLPTKCINQTNNKIGIIIRYNFPHLYEYCTYDNGLGGYSEELLYTSPNNGDLYEEAIFWDFNPPGSVNYTINYSNYRTYNNKNYTNNLTYNLSWKSNSSFSNILIGIYFNQSNVYNLTINSLSNNYTYGNITYLEGYYEIYFKIISSSLNDTSINQTFGNSTFYFDTSKPAINRISLNLTNIFNSTNTANLYLNCSDISQVNLTYNLTFNDNRLFYGNLTDAYLLINSSSVIDGDNIIIATCSDLFGSTKETLTYEIFKKSIILIDERENILFNLDNCSGAKMYADLNKSMYNFKAANQNQLNISFLEGFSNKLRFEFEYIGGIIVLVYIDLSLIDENDLRICVNKEGVQRYEQLLTATSQKVSVLKNIYSDCYVAADYTKHAYQSTYILKAITIDSFYNLYTMDDGESINLAGIDGSEPAYINLDNLQFQQSRVSLNIQPDSLTFQNDDAAKEMTIYYYNSRQDNEILSGIIRRMDTDEIVYSNTFTDPNEFTLYFSYATLDNVTNASIFVMEINKTLTSGLSITFKRYFNALAKSGTLQTGIAFFIAIVLTVAGLTFTASKTALGWFGAFMVIGSMVVLSFAIASWYITFFFVIDMIIFIYIIIMIVMQTHPAMS